MRIGEKCPDQGWGTGNGQDVPSGLMIHPRGAADLRGSQGETRLWGLQAPPSPGRPARSWVRRARRCREPRNRQAEQVWPHRSEGCARIPQERGCPTPPLWLGVVRVRSQASPELSQPARWWTPFFSWTRHPALTCLVSVSSYPGVGGSLAQLPPAHWVGGSGAPEPPEALRSPFSDWGRASVRRGVGTRLPALGLSSWPAWGRGGSRPASGGVHGWSPGGVHGQPWGGFTAGLRGACTECYTGGRAGLPSGLIDLLGLYGLTGAGDRLLTASLLKRA